ncbi:MAG: L,D-transpeptidase [Verrucomicrobiota bacterium]
MHSFSQRLLVAAALLAVGSLSSCKTTRSQMTSFDFDPPVASPSSASQVKVHISTGAQRIYVTEGEKVLLASPVSVGRATSPTPPGLHRITSKTKERRRFGEPGRGYPMTYWMSFYSPAYGMHWGFVKPYPCTAGCVRLPLNTARKTFNLVQVGTPVSVASRQPWDDTIGAKLPRLDDAPLPNPPMSYMKSPQVFADAEQGRMWKF